MKQNLINHLLIVAEDCILCYRLNNRSSEGYGDLLYPWGVATTKDDQIIVVDDGNQRIHFFEADGVPLRTFSAATGATLTALAQQGGGQQHNQNTSPGIHAAAAQPESRPQPHGKRLLVTFSFAAKFWSNHSSIKIGGFMDIWTIRKPISPLEPQTLDESRLE